MKYKLIISDLDGTLEGKDRILSKPLIEAINRWKNSGGLFTIASGRQYLMIKDDCTGITLDTPLIARGGAEIVDPKNGKVIFSKHIDAKIVEEIIKVLKQNDIFFTLEKDDSFYSSTTFDTGYKNIKHKNLSEFKLTDIPKIRIRSDVKDPSSFEKIIREKIEHKYPELYVVRSVTPFGAGWDITHLSATKHLATLELIKMLNIPREETVGVGDGYNDFPLLEACGLKVAMGNAVEDLKAIADMVVPSYQEDGVAVLIDKLLTD